MASWTAHVEGGPRRVNHAAVCIDGIIYSFGGFCTGDNFGVRQDIDIHRFDTVSYSWTKLEYLGDPDDIPYQRYGHAAVAYGNTCIIYGGRNDANGASEHIYQFDVATRTWHRPPVTGAIPLSRDGHSCCVIGDSMFLFAGFEEQSVEFSRTVYSLDLITFEWRFCITTGMEPLWRDFHSATAWRQYMVVFGGRSDELGPLHTNSEIYDNDIYLFDTVEQHWISPEVTGDIPEGRRSHCAFEHDDKVYIFGGYNGKLGKHYNDLYMFDPEKQSWTRCNPGGVLPRARRRACCCKDQNKLLIFGGTSPDSTKVAAGEAQRLTDLSDLHVLDMSPSLRTLCMMVVLERQLSYAKILPASITHELQALSRNATTSRVPNG